MTRKKSNVKALALAVTCAILAGGGIGLEPVYATNVDLNVSSGTITAGSINGTITGTVDGVAITDGTITGGSLTGGTFNGTVTLTGDNIKTAIEGVDISLAKVGSDTSSLTIGGLATNTQKIIYAAETGTTVDGVVLKDKGITAAGGKFTVNGTNAETVVSGDNGKTTIYGGGINVEGAGGNGHVAISSGSVSVDVSVLSPTFYVDRNNQFTQNSLKVGDGTNSVTIADGKITTTGNIQGKDITATGALNVAKDATVGGNLGVTGDTTVGGDLTVTKKIKGESLNIGATGSEFIVDTVGNINAKAITTSDSGVNKIGGVTLSGSDINAKNLTLTGTLTAAKYNADDIEATKSIKVGETTMTNGKLDLGSNGTIDFGANELTDVQVGNINSVIQNDGIVRAADGSVIGGVTFSAKDITGVKDLTATGKVTAATITDGTASLSGGALTGLASVNIGDNTAIDNTGIMTNKLTVGSGLNVTTIDDANGVMSVKGEIGAVRFSGSGKLDNVNAIDGVSVAQNSGSAAGGLTFGSNAIIGATGIPFQSTGFKVDDDGDVEGKTFTTAADGTGNRSTLASGSLTIAANNTWTKDAGIIASNVKVGSNELKNDGLHVGTNTTVKDGELTVGAGNTWSMANGITASKAGINGVTIGETEGKATFNNAGNTTTIDGNKITTGTITADELNVDKISLGKGTDKNITIGSNGDVTTKGDVTVTGDDNDTTVIDGAKATFGNDAANQTVIDKGKISAKAEDNNHQKAGLTFNENGLTVSGQNAEGKTSSFSFNAKTGANTFTGQDKTFTTINGSSVRSYNSATGAGHLNGATLNLWKDNDNSTYMTAGGATFNGAAGEKGGKTTTINGGTITTDTLNVDHINLGGEMVDKNGTTFGSNLSMDNQGNFSAAGGNFKVTGGSGADKGAFTNTVGNTTLQTDNAGASMKFNNTAATNGVESKVTVEANKATVAAGDKASFVANADNGGSATITGGTQTVTTTDNGTEFKNSAHNTPFEGGNATTTIINGNEITTGKITTDQLVITGQGNAHGNGSIAFGGNGTIKSDINDGNGKNTSFETKLEGVNTKVTDGKTTTENKVSATGNSNTVKQDDTHKSEFNQGLTSIGGVVTNGTVKIAQTLDGGNGNITNEVTDKDGKSSKLVQNGTGLEYTDSAKPDNATRIDSSDVSIGSATDDSKRINLSDLGQIDELDKELTDRDEYKNNPTAVGGINAEAAIRREEVARLDGRINDVNDRVNKVGAMAAAIASLKSIGYDPQAPSEFSIGLGQYKGETGVAMGFFHYPNKNFMINVSLSTAGGETMGGIGATWRFGHKSPQKLLEEQREAQARKELAAAEKYQAAAKLAKEAQERAEYAAKLARQAQVSADNAKAAADATQAKHFG